MISILVPIYRVEPYLRACLDSLHAQTESDLEILLIDDGSPDACPQICDEYCRIDSRFFVLHKENGGLIRARKDGLSLCHGDYIGFVDGDDYIEPTMFEEFSKAIRQYQPDMLMCAYFENATDTQTENHSLFNQPFYDRSALEQTIFPKMLYAGTFYHFGIQPNCWSKVFRREVLEKALSAVDDRTRMGEDASFVYPCLFASQSLCVIDKPLYHYRAVTSSMSRGYDQTLADRLLLPYICLSKLSEDRFWQYQMAYYYLYLLHFAFRNQAKQATGTNDRAFIRQMLSGNSGCLPEGKGLPKHTALFLFLFRRRMKAGLALYLRFLRFYLNSKPNKNL